MSTHAKHPTEVESTNPADQPVSAATAVKLAAFLGLTEGEAQAILSAEPATPAELVLAEKVDLHALAGALTEETVHAVLTDTKLELGIHAKDFAAQAARVRTYADAEVHLQHGISDIHGAARLDASACQEALNAIVPQLRTRSRVNPAVTKTYRPILAYQHARFPGRHGAATPPTPPVAVAAAKP